MSMTTSPEARNELSKREKMELEFLYPSAFDPTQSDPEPSYRDAEPKFFLHVQNDRVEGFLAPFPTVIDFSLPNTRILSAQFVCLRKLPSPTSATTSPQPRAPRRGVLGMLRRSAPSAESSSKQTGGAAQTSETSLFRGFWTPGGKHAGPKAQRVPWAQSASESTSLGTDNDLQMFELLWKEAQAPGTGNIGTGDSIRHLKFETNQMGYDMISSKLDKWAVAAHAAAITDPMLASVMVMEEKRKDRIRSSLSAADSEGIPRSSEPSSPSVAIASLSPRKGLGSPKDSIGTLPDGRARIEAAKAAVDIVGQGSGPRPAVCGDNVISWGSVWVEGKFAPKTEAQSAILREGHFMALTAALPARLRSSTWKLLYSKARDGISLNTLYRKVANRGPMILVARDSNHFVFGCYCSEEWRMSSKYYGNGECFVFQVQPELRAYRWTRANSYFMYSTKTVLAMGGGTHYSLLINSDLMTGFSGECETFGNTQLSGTEEFQLRQLEVWGFK